ncbi:MAG: ABC transporter permease subunit, partial [Bdellovibrionota bacterium]
MTARRLMSLVVPPSIPLVLVTVALEIVAKNAWVPTYLMPAPSDVLRSMIDDREELWSGFRATAIAAFAGLALSFVVGTSFAILLSASRFLKRAIYPYAIFFQTVPIIAIAPLLVIWFGFGQPTVIASAFIVSIFPIVASTLLGLESTDPALVDLFRLYSAGPIERMTRLRIPFALPQMFSGLR